MRNIALIACLALGGCGGGGGAPSPASPPISPTLAWQYSPGMAGQCENFDFPPRDGAHYCVRSSGPITMGQWVTLRFTITGDGTLLQADPTDSPPTFVRLYIQRRGDDLTGSAVTQDYRWWSTVREPLTPGEHSLTMQLTPESWSQVFGATGDTRGSAFQAALNDPVAIGYTLGGNYFAGHGVYSQGYVHFSLTQFSVNSAKGLKRKKRK